MKRIINELFKGKVISAIISEYKREREGRSMPIQMQKV